jgi:hypothetical protein
VCNVHVRLMLAVRMNVGVAARVMARRMLGCAWARGDCESGHVAVMVRVVVSVSVSVGLNVMVIAWMSVGVVVRAGSVG